MSTLSAFVAHGHADNKLPVAWAHKADAWLTQLDVKHETRLYNMGHEITGEEVEDFVRWLKTVLPAAPL